MRHDVHLPVLYKGMAEQDTAIILHWYVQDQDVIQPNELLLRVETAPSNIDIPQPFSTACQIVKIHKGAGTTVHIGDLLVTLETADNPSS